MGADSTAYYKRTPSAHNNLRPAHFGDAPHDVLVQVPQTTPRLCLRQHLLGRLRHCRICILDEDGRLLTPTGFQPALHHHPTRRHIIHGRRVAAALKRCLSRHQAHHRPGCSRPRLMTPSPVQHNHDEQRSVPGASCGMHMHLIK